MTFIIYAPNQFVNKYMSGLKTQKVPYRAIIWPAMAHYAIWSSKKMHKSGKLTILLDMFTVIYNFPFVITINTNNLGQKSLVLEYSANNALAACLAAKACFD